MQKLQLENIAHCFQDSKMIFERHISYYIVTNADTQSFSKCHQIVFKGYSRKN